MGSLLERIAALETSKGKASYGGLETLLDLTTLDEIEYKVYRKRESELVYRINQIRERRTPLEEIRARLDGLMAGRCRRCLDAHRLCRCGPTLRQWE